MILFERQTDPIYANSARMQTVYELDTLFLHGKNKLELAIHHS